MSSHWEYPTHRDVSVLWWKSYLKSAIEKEYSEDESPTTIERMIRILQEEDIFGLNVDKSWFGNSPIHFGPFQMSLKVTLTL